MFANSSPAFGVKPATPAGGTSIFGQPTQPQQQQQGTSLFGQPANTNTNTGTGLFGQPANTNTSTGTGLFGQPANTNTNTGTGLFGQSTNTNQSGTGTGLFGASMSTNTGTGGGLFGAQNNQQQGTGTGTGLFGQSTTGGASLFGAQNNQQQTQTTGTTGGGLFGAGSGGTSLFGAQNNQQQQPQQGASLFGQSNTNTGGGLFGQSTTQNNTTGGGGLFGQSTTGTTGGLFGQNQNNQQSTGTGLFGQSTGGGLFGQPQQQQQQQQQTGSLFGGSTTLGANNNTQQTSSLFGRPAGGQQLQTGLSNQQAPPFTKTTKFNDLPDEIKRMFEQIDSHIQGRVQISKDLHQRKLGEEATKGQELLKEVHRELSHTSNTIRNDLQFTRDLKTKADQAVQDTIVATRIIDGFKNPQANGQYLKDHASFPLEFFTRISRQTKERLAWYKSTIEQIERKLSSMANQPNITPQRIVSAVQAQHATFLALAGRTATLDAELQKIKAIYTQLWRARTGSVRDPFDGGADIEESGLGSKGDLLTLSTLNIR